MATDDYTQDGPLAREIAQVIPYFPFKGIPRFYDVGGLLASPTHFQKVVDIMAARYGDLKIDAIGGFDARGFLFTPVALALNKPFFMLRKKEKCQTPYTANSTRRSTPAPTASAYRVAPSNLAIAFFLLTT
ncbi:pribosyltran domain-containing protein [Pycnococcus provasolii]